MLRRGWLRIRSRGNWGACWVLQRVATISQETVWTDHYATSVNPSRGPFKLYMEVVSRLHTYRFGQGLGIRFAVNVMEVTVTQHLLTGQMRMIHEAAQYVGLNRRDLFYLLRHDFPWLKELPKGRPGEDRPYDRRPPKYIE